MYKVKHKKPRTYNYDLVVIGSGSGGGVAAHIVAHAGKSVAIVEQEKVGGECPNFGCVPTKALLQAAETYSVIKERDNIAVLKGHAHFISPHTVNVGGKRISAKRFLIATGTHDVVPPINGIHEVGYWTYRDAIEQTKVPRRLFVIGGGAIGLEFTHLFSTFGSEVTIAEFAPRLLIREDQEMGELVAAMMEQRGVNVLVNTKVTSVKKNKDGSKVVNYEQNGVAKQQTVDEILLAAGIRECRGEI